MVQGVTLKASERTSHSVTVLRGLKLTFSGRRAGATRAISRPNPPIFANVDAASICSTISWSSCARRHANSEIRGGRQRAEQIR